jgi:hypothetical protein
MFLCFVAVSLFFVPNVLLAQAPPPSTIIPCGFDDDTDGVVRDSSTSPDEECKWNDIIILAQNVINFLIFSIAAPLAAVMFAYAGFLYVTNNGNEGKVRQAHEIFLYVFWGLVVCMAAWLTVNYVLVFFLGASSGFNLLS